MDGTTVYVLLVIVAATLVRSAFGFGEALVAVPLLAIRLPINIAAPLAVLVSITVAALIIAQDWRHIHLRTARWLVFPTLFGIPLGLLLLTHGNHRLVKGTLAVIIVVFSTYSLLGRKPPELHSDSRVWLLGCGFCAGIMGGAYGMNGPPLAIYGAMRRWSAQHFRATLH
ncbi:MAG TPA: sulfite exporter TauE/SafE family protein [Candidatus Angelobacter sp.]|nr:sulfite exporter TauE/SafE family protein [Candidatus Angelobacter sp.]